MKTVLQIKFYTCVVDLFKVLTYVLMMSLQVVNVQSIINERESFRVEFPEDSSHHRANTIESKKWQMLPMIRIKERLTDG